MDNDRKDNGHNFIEQAKEKAQYYYKRGGIYNKKEFFNEAIEELTKAIDLDSENAMYYCKRGIAFGEIGDLENAISDFNMAINIDDECGSAYNNRGVVYHLQEANTN